MQRLFRGEKSLSGLYADGTFRTEDFFFNFAAGRDGWVIPSEKMSPGLYIAVRTEDIFLLGISQSPGPPEITTFSLSAALTSLLLLPLLFLPSAYESEGPKACGGFLFHSPCHISPVPV